MSKQEPEHLSCLKGEAGRVCAYQAGRLPLWWRLGAGHFLHQEDYSCTTCISSATEQVQCPNNSGGSQICVQWSRQASKLSHAAAPGESVRHSLLQDRCPICWPGLLWGGGVAPWRELEHCGDTAGACPAPGLVPSTFLHMDMQWCCQGGLECNISCKCMVK